MHYMTNVFARNIPNIFSRKCLETEVSIYLMSRNLGIERREHVDPDKKELKSQLEVLQEEGHIREHREALSDFLAALCSHMKSQLSSQGFLKRDHNGTLIRSYLLS